MGLRGVDNSASSPVSTLSEEVSDVDNVKSVDGATKAKFSNLSYELALLKIDSSKIYRTMAQQQMAQLQEVSKERESSVNALNFIRNDFLFSSSNFNVEDINLFDGWLSKLDTLSSVDEINKLADDIQNNASSNNVALPHIIDDSPEVKQFVIQKIKDNVITLKKELLIKVIYKELSITPNYSDKDSDKARKQKDLVQLQQRVDKYNDQSNKILVQLQDNMNKAQSCIAKAYSFVDKSLNSIEEIISTMKK